MEATSKRPRAPRLLTLTEVYAAPRIDSRVVAGNLTLLESPSWRRHPLEVTADTALLAGCLNALSSFNSSRAELLHAACLLVGDDYAAGFREGFDCAAATQRRTLRYVEGLDDGGMVGYAVRHAARD